MNTPDYLGYSDAEYTASLHEFGDPLRLALCQGSVLIRPTPRRPYTDAVGPYPIFSCADWTRLPEDIEALAPDLVSLTLVADPLGAWPVELLRDSFPDRMLPFKQHFVVELTDGAVPAANAHHRRNARKALKRVKVDVVRPQEVLDDWIALYSNLVARHGIRGISAFSPSAFAMQVRLPGLTAIRARENDTTVGCTLWLRQNAGAYYHLGAYSDRGYELGASFALFAVAIEHFASEGLAWLSLGAGAGTDASDADATDGLTRFKAGWSTSTRTAYLCGRILNRARYSELAGETVDTGYFPVYRRGDVA